ncbi:MAG: hypothetical protein OXD01_07285 [Gammaproteobacteria bacterium]|nr:hypothetical protein [Gammaproteobacteria bacterium]
MNHMKFRSLINQLYSTVAELEALFPGRHFTLDGHIVGSIGECLVADSYGLELVTASNKGYDAISKREGKKVEIKATQSNKVAFRSKPEHIIVIKILTDGSFEEFYNGPGDPVWQKFDGKPIPKNGQYQISLNTLKILNKDVLERQKIDRVDGHNP